MNLGKVVFLAQLVSFLVVLNLLGCGSTALVNPKGAQLPSLSLQKYPLAAKPEARHIRQSRYIAKFLANDHIAKLAIDDQVSERMLAIYLDALDPNKLYLTQSEVDEFSQFKHSLDNMILAGELTPLYQMHAKVTRRTAQRFESSMLTISSMADSGINADGESCLPRYWLKSIERLQAQWAICTAKDFKEVDAIVNSKSNSLAILQARYQHIMQALEPNNPQNAFEQIANALTKSFDPHTQYFSPWEVKKAQESEYEFNLTSIGVELEADGLYAKIKNIVQDSPAANSHQVKIGDRLIGLQYPSGSYIDLVGRKLVSLVDDIRSNKTPQMSLILVKGEKQLPVKVSMARIFTDIEEGYVDSKLIQDGDKKFAVINIRKFYVDWESKMRKDHYRSVSKDLREELTRLQKQTIDGLIINLKNNGGGALDEGIFSSGLFIGEQTIVHDRNKRGQIEHFESKEAPIVNGLPIVVLVNSKTAGSAEIMAAALQDFGKAIIVGRNTYGMGTVQRILDLNRVLDRPSRKKPLGALKMTINEYYRADGSPFQQRGVVPDILIQGDFANELRESSSLYPLPSESIDTREIDTAKLQGAMLKPRIDELNKRLASRAQRFTEKQFKEAPISIASVVLQEWLLLDAK